ncbi:mechanosensitive ion channel family protein [Treponema socranskii]|uniref:mechanosensitive ion channel family protein n=1 Tax=Treponema socranskii TaxID=53419 RepID=UPI0015D7A21D|nr:mechanosensitive ion channel family protein [Treponema socranskii]
MDESTSAVTIGVQQAQEQLSKHKETLFAWVKSFFTWTNLFRAAGALFVIAIIWFLYKLAVHALSRVSEQKINKQNNAALHKLLKYVFYSVLGMYILSCFGIKLTALLGAAGIAGLAVGFAAQTTVSNVISGLFVITEGVVKVGDLIVVSGVTGNVDSIDLLSTKVHTLDNQLVRIPNSLIINTTFQNNSYYATRRITFAFGLKYGTDIRSALDVLLKAPELCETVIKKPAPAVWIDGFGDSNINMTVAVWCKSSDFLKTKNDMFVALMRVMNENGLVMSYNCVEIVPHDDSTPVSPPAKKSAAKRS